MDRETYSILDFPLLLKWIGDQATSSITREKILNLKTGKSREEIKKLLLITGEWIDILEKEEISFSDIVDIKNLIKKAFTDAEGLSVSNFYDIANTLYISFELKNRLKNSLSKYPLTAELLYTLPALENLWKKIDTAIDEKRQIKDSATKNLHRIRKQIINQKQHLSNLSKKQTDKYERFLQEKFTIQRNGRYVIAVKSEKQKRISGIIHDVSESGSTVFLEPIELVPENNKLQKLLKDEHWEIKKILRELSESVFENKDYLISTFTTLVDFDVISAKARLSKKIGGILPDEGKIDLNNARHPLLLLLKGKENTYPLDLKFPDNINAILISGPNAGGKTIALKTVGTILLLAYIGVHIPVGAKTNIPYDYKIFTEGGDHQSIEDNISTFSGRVGRWKKLLEIADDKTLILIDEIGSSTDPEKGSALAISYINDMIRKGTKIIATTNIMRLKMEVEKSDVVINSSMDMNTDNYEPTYHLTMGIPGSSFTFEIAEKFGLPKHIIEESKKLISSSELNYEQVITRTKELLIDIETEKILLEEKIKEHEEITKNVISEKNIFEQERKYFFKDIKIKQKELLHNMRKKAENLIKEIKETQAGKESIKKTRDFLLPKPKNRKLVVNNKMVFKTGDLIWLKNMNTKGKITNIHNNEISVNTGTLQIICNRNNIEPLQEKDEINIEESVIFTRNREISSKIDLRGFDSNSAIEELVKFLDDVELTGYPFVTVIHGIGTGKLKTVIEKYLLKNKYIFRSGQPPEGGSGVTIINLNFE